MKEKFVMHYDEGGDLLELRIGDSTDSYFEDLGNDIFERVDRKTGEVKGLAIFNFKKRIEKDLDINIELPFDIS